VPPDKSDPLEPIDPRPLDILDGNFYVDDPYSRYAWLRENSPVHWDDINEMWCITRYDDIVAIEKDKTTFSNAGNEKGGYRPNIPADGSIIGADDPQHLARRNLVSRRFTPRAVTQWEEHISAVVAELVDNAVETGEADVVTDLAAPLPAKMIGFLLGFPDDMWTKLQHWSETTIALGGGPRYFTEEGSQSALDFAVAASELYEEKKGCPAHDVMTRWTEIEAESDGAVGGAPFGVSEIVSDCLLLLDGGAETTRTVIARTLLELADRPDQWQLLKDGADLDVAVEEFIRWVTPVHNFCRIATEDVELHGQTILAGQQVILLYGSANRSPEHFDSPNTFDVTRDLNPHISFGFGTHFCLGASLARLEIKLLFERLLEKAATIERLADRPHVEMPNAFVYGLKESHVALTPE
jgi:cytochrome P450 family 142 subfamily A polypeptide 1